MPVEEHRREAEGFTGAEIKLVVVEAGYMAVRENRLYVTMNDLLKAIEKVKSKKTIRDSWQQIYSSPRPTYQPTI
jgi:proteasome regulatory subunit